VLLKWIFVLSCDNWTTAGLILIKFCISDPCLSALPVLCPLFESLSSWHSQIENLEALRQATHQNHYALRTFPNFFAFLFRFINYAITQSVEHRILERRVGGSAAVTQPWVPGSFFALRRNLSLAQCVQVQHDQLTMVRRDIGWNKLKAFFTMGRLLRKGVPKLLMPIVTNVSVFHITSTARRPIGRQYFVATWTRGCISWAEK
jgi:hypothetical protein